MVARSPLAETGRPQIGQQSFAGGGLAGLAMSSSGQFGQPPIHVVGLKARYLPYSTRQRHSCDKSLIIINHYDWLGKILINSIYKYR